MSTPPDPATTSDDSDDSGGSGSGGSGSGGPGSDGPGSDGSGSGRLLRPVVMRDRTATHRAATPLELLFDLCFVVAVAVLAADLHHGLAENHALSAVVTYAVLFVPIWWAWMSYTWFATAFDNDDVLFRILTLAQMGGVLVLAATLPTAAAGNPVPFTLAYTAMRLPLVVHWLRAAHDDPAHRVFAQRYAIGTLAAQAVWLLALAVPLPWRLAVWALALAVDLLTPPWAVKAAPGRVFHAGHIAERYGLFTIIVLGETLLAVAVGARDVVEAGAVDLASVTVCAAALVIAFALWWIYFDALGREALERNRRAAFVWGYGHLLLYAAIAAIGAGVQAQLDDHGGELPAGAALFVAVPAALALGSTAWLQLSANLRRASAVTMLVAAGVILALATLLRSSSPAVVDALVAIVVVAVVVVEIRGAAARR